ncbi:MAG: polyvinylalcohol dehydrogenase, partial [bacterium]
MDWGTAFSLSVANGIICTVGNIEKDTVITALNMEGEVSWRAENGKAWTGDQPPGSRSIPTIDGTRIYHQSPLGSIVCLKDENGDVVWELDILSEVGS